MKPVPPMEQREHLDLTCMPASTLAGQVRTMAEFRLIEWGFGGARHAELRDGIHLVADELVVNACHETPGRPIRVQFLRETGTLLFGVWDSSDRLPEPRPPELTLETLETAAPDDNGGWGYPLIAALSDEYGVTPTHPRGKWAWARFKT